MKPKMPCITEPDEDLVHYESESLMGNVTLCGITDFLGSTSGEYTDESVTCSACQAIFKFCNSHRA